MRRELERRQSWRRRQSAGFSLACRGPHALNTQGPSQARAACGSRPGPGSSLSSLGSEVSAEMPAGGARLRDGDSCPPQLTRSDGPPSPAGAPAAPSVMAHPGLRPPPPPPNPPAGIFPVLQAVGHIFQILGPLLLPPQIPRRPQRPPLPWERPQCPDTCSSWPGEGEEQLAGPSSCEVRGCQGEEPRLWGRHGKAARRCSPDPSCPQPRSAPSLDFWPPSGPRGRWMGLQQEPLCPPGHRLCPTSPSAWAELPGSGRGNQP